MDEGFPLQKANSKDRKWNITRELMINVVFHNIDSGMGVSLYADDGIMWRRGRNLEFITGKVQEAIFKVTSGSLHFQWIRPR